MFTEMTNQKDAKRMSKLLKQWHNVGVIRKMLTELKDSNAEK